MSSIVVKNVTKKFKKITALDNVSLEIKDGEFFCILGPPGAGKTTLLRTIVGLEKSDEGEILIDNEVVNSVHPSQRDIAMIFQNLALYPDKTVFENIAFPLQQQKMSEEEIKPRVEKVAKQLKIDWLLDKIPSKLSGGERQRVAIGRAIVRQPKAYLMDEPLSNLDALLRLEMRVSLKELQTNLKETFVYVTHDQVEALSMGDRIALMDKGVVQQIDTPEAAYRYPKNTFAATIIGNPPMNFIKCSVKKEDGSITILQDAFSFRPESSAVADILSKNEQDKIIVGIRPEDIVIHETKPAAGAIAAKVYVYEPLGNETVVDVSIGDTVIKVLTDPDFYGDSGQEIWLTMNTEKLHLFDYETGEVLVHLSEEDKVKLLE
jgi:multiple sugar transport system ATP-binding protein